MSNRSFSLCSDRWLKIAGGRSIGLYELCETNESLNLGGNPLEKYLAFRFLLALFQNVIRVDNEEEIQDISIEEMKEILLKYLRKNCNLFELYDRNRPFLQFPSIKSKKPQLLAGLIPGVSTGNTTVLTELNSVTKVSDAEKVYVLLQQVMFAFSGKKPDNSIVLNPTIKKSKSAPASPSVGYLHCFVLGQDLMHTIWMNLLTQEALEEVPTLSEGFGVAPWECMPDSENDGISEKIKASYIGRLIPLSRFCRLDGQYMHFTEGVTIPNISVSAFADLSIPVSIKQKSGKTEAKGLLAKREKQPWRQLDAILGFCEQEKSFKCKQLSFCLGREGCEGPRVGIWCVGIQLTSQAGEQYLSGKDGYIESSILLDKNVKESLFFANYKSEIERLEKLSKVLSMSVKRYFVDLGSKVSGEDYSRSCVSIFWKESGLLASKLINVCQEKDIEKIFELRKEFAEIALSCFEKVCSSGNSRQILAFAKNRPKVGWYLKKNK